MEIGDDLSLELRMKGFKVFETETDLGCLSGEVFRDGGRTSRGSEIANAFG